MPLLDLPNQIIDRLDVLGLEPLKAFRFAVEIDGLPQGSRFVAGFSQVEGLEGRTEVREVKEGGYRGVHRFPRRRLDGPVRLMRVMTISRFLWDWYLECSNWSPGQSPYARSLSIWMIDAINAPMLNREVTFEVWRWNLFGAWISQWTGPRLDALADQIAAESIEVQHQGLTVDKGVLDGTVAEVAGLFGQR